MEKFNVFSTTCPVSFIVVPYATSLRRFQNNAAKVWRWYNPVRKGRRSEQTLIFISCHQLLTNGEIGDTTSLAELTKAVRELLEKDKHVPIPHEDTICKHVKTWRTRLREMTEEGGNLLQVSDGSSDEGTDNPQEASAALLKRKQ